VVEVIEIKGAPGGLYPRYEPTPVRWASTGSANWC